MPKIKELFAWVIAAKDEDDEGIPAINTPIGPLPMVGSDVERAASFRQHAQLAADHHGKPVRLIKSTAIEIVEIVQPRPNKTAN
jgi:hypothetical protein